MPASEKSGTMFTSRVRATLIGLLLVLGDLRPTSASETVAFNSGSKVLHGRLYKPAGAGPFRAILYNHGSAPGSLNDQAFDLIWPRRYGAKKTQPRATKSGPMRSNA